MKDLGALFFTVQAQLSSPTSLGQVSFLLCFEPQLRERWDHIGGRGGGNAQGVFLSPPIQRDGTHFPEDVRMACTVSQNSSQKSPSFLLMLFK